ncbi:gamma carbonic anhydrase family protein [Brevirhabdus sp.]|uniref:gamma carbonic anhydrase family protein n=1 Tax=Brevirhabdus sp. TaxID=2004514 RepID=UPI004058FAA6
MLTTLPFDGTAPAIASAPTHAGPGAAVLGRATIGRAPWLGRSAVIRADGHYVSIGDDMHLGADATVHIVHEMLPCIIGHRATIGQGAVVHACTLGDDCLIGPGAIVLDAAVLGDGVVLDEGAVVFPRSQLEGGWRYAGAPAKPVERIDGDALRECHRQARAATVAAETGAETAPETGAGPAAVSGQAEGSARFVADNALLSGAIRFAPDSSIWFGCTLRGGASGIALGARSNIQDNAKLDATQGAIRIGADVTIGHNATLAACDIADGSLIGIGARVAPGTVVETGALLAAGAQTEPDQLLGAGYLWAGRPARRKRALTEEQRAALRETIPAYCGYALSFAKAQKAKG